MAEGESGQGAVITSPGAAVTAIEDMNACVGIAREMEHLAVAMDRAIADRSAAQTIEPLMTLLLFTRRLVAATGAFASMRTIVETTQHAAALASVGAELEASLHELARALRDGRAPSLAPATTTTIELSLIHI